jgi:hypothetical protein
MTMLMSVAAAFVAAYVAVLSVVLCMLALILIAHLTTATWFGGFRTRAERVVASMPALAALGIVVIVPLVIVLSRPANAVANPARQSFMAPWFLALRAVVYWTVWLAIGAALRAARRAELQGDIAKAAHRVRVTSCAGLVALALTMTFASFDWMMSLTPGWWSTIFGIYWFGGGMVGALSTLALSSGGWWRDRAAPPVDSGQRRALGKLLLTFVLFWLYAGYAQYIVIWSADIPREVVWYIPRMRGGWGAVALTLLVAGGALPLLALVRSQARESASWLAALSGVLLVVHYLDNYWLVVPGLVAFHWWMTIISAAALAVVVAPAAFLARRS